MSVSIARARSTRRDRAACTETDWREPCGGAAILDLALCLILAGAVTGLLVLAL